MTVADIGAGTGFFAIPIAEQVGPTGTVHTVDFQRKMLDMLSRKLSQHQSHLKITLSEGDASHTGLLEASCDLVFMANLWHELDHHDFVLQEASRVLRRNGRLAILDWRHDCLPPPGPPSNHRTALQDVIALLKEEAWSIHYSTHVGKYSYLVIGSPALTKPDA